MGRAGGSGAATARGVGRLAGSVAALGAAVGVLSTVVGVVAVASAAVGPVDVLDAVVGALGPVGTVVGVVTTATGPADVLDAVVSAPGTGETVVDALTALGTVTWTPGNAGAVTGENEIVSTAGPIATHDVFTVYEPATFDVNDTLNVVSLTFVTVPTTTLVDGLPLASNTRTSN